MIHLPDNDVMFEDEERAVEPAAAPFFTVAIYLCDRAWGGPEEGGWWYDYGQRVDDFAGNNIEPNDYLGVYPSRAAAEAGRAALQAKLDAEINVGRRDISSVLSEGRYEAEIYNGHPPKFWPERRPHYE